MDSVMQCVNLVRPMFEAAAAGEYERLRELAKTTFKAEHEADLIKDEIRRSIPKRFFLPVYRGDLLGYLKLQDDMADTAEDLAVLLTVKDLKLPPELRDEVSAFVNKVMEVCCQTKKIAEFLPTLVDAEMTGQEAEQAVEMVAHMERTEWEADRVQYALSQHLFALEDEMKASDLFLWFRVFGELGQLANFAEKTGDRLRRMLVN